MRGALLRNGGGIGAPGWVVWFSRGALLGVERDEGRPTEERRGYRGARLE